jgi:hypothetical protein
MDPLPAPSVSPLYSFCSRPPGLPKPLPFPEQFALVLAWPAGRKPTHGQRQSEDNIVNALIREAEKSESAPVAIPHRLRPR